MRSPKAKTIESRSVEPEILDELPTDHPAAIASRRDLHWVNSLMFQPGFMARALRRHTDPPRRMLDLGSGDGLFTLQVARRMARRWPGVEVVLLDKAPAVSAGMGKKFSSLGWRMNSITADVTDFLESETARSFDLVAANLFLHHFEDDALTRLFRGIQRVAPRLVATEPCRASLAHASTGLLRLIGVDKITLHDAAASVRAGFSGKELSGLWQEAGGRPLEDRRAGIFTHVFAGHA